MFGLLTLGFWVLVLAICVYFIDTFNQVEIFGPILLRKALSMMLMSFSGLLLFSNVITALSSYFLSEDMQLIQALPISGRRLFYLRAIDTIVSSSWMMLIFGLPVLLAYGAVHGGGPLYYLIAFVGLFAYLIPPAALGIAFACLLVRGFSARRVRELMTLVSAVFLIALVLLLRGLQPEQLVDPEAFETLAEFIAVARTPDASWLPSTWLSDLCMWALGQHHSGVALQAGLLFIAGPALLILARWLVAPLWFEAWTRAQEAPTKSASRSRVVCWLIDTVTLPAPRVFRALLRKDIRLFLREPGQWTQGLLLCGLVVIYLYSIAALPLDTLALREMTKNVIGFLNVGVAGAVLAAIAVRFNFIAVSNEGRAFWVLHGSPIGARRFLLSKFLIGFFPTLLLGEVLVISTCAMLDTSPLFTGISVATIFLLSIGLTGLAVGMGALYPNFKADSAARMASGPGAILFMVLALLFVGGVVALESVPIAAVLMRHVRDEEVGPGLQAAVIAVALVVILANILVAWIPMRRGARKLWGDLGAP
jgi:ABC-2 type transport system permease protein